MSMSLYDQHMKHSKNHRKDRYYQQCSDYFGDGTTEEKSTNRKCDYSVMVKYDNDSIDTFLVTASHHKEAVEIMKRESDKPCYIFKVWNHETENEDQAIVTWIRAKGWA